MANMSNMDEENAREMQSMGPLSTKARPPPVTTAQQQACRPHTVATAQRNSHTLTPQNLQQIAIDLTTEDEEEVINEETYLLMKLV